MKYSARIFFLTLLALIGTTTVRLYSQSANGGLKISVTGLRNNKGKVLLTLFNSEKGFPASTSDAVFKAESLIKNGVATIVYDAIVNGEFAIAVMHDENNNQKMDTKMFGLPKEGYGFSNDVMGTFGPPSFKKASFSYPAKKEVFIKMKY